jgi:hypothetical protein
VDGPPVDVLPPLVGPLPAGPGAPRRGRLERWLATGAEPPLRPAVRPAAAAAGRLPSWVVARVARRVLGEWDPIVRPEPERTAVVQRLGGWESVHDPETEAELVARVLALLRPLCGSAWARRVQAAERRTDVPFHTEVPGLGALHGSVDLLYRPPGEGWRLVAWVTEPVTPASDWSDLAAPYLARAAVQRRVVADVLGAAPAVELCFLRAGAAIHEPSAAELDTALALLAADRGGREP